MKKKLFTFLKILILFFLFFPVNTCLLEDIIPELECENEKTNNLKYYIGGFVILTIICGLLYSNGFDFPFHKTDPYDTTIEYKYPNDGVCRPPENPTFVPMYDYFCIPGKPYFVNGEINYPLLNKDMMTYLFTAQFCPTGQDIPWYFIRGFEMLWGYDIHQEVFMNLQFHRCTFPLDYGMDTVLAWTKWYYAKFPPRMNYFPWCHQSDVVTMYDLMEKDWYDVRIWPDIYTKARSLPMYVP